MKQLTVHGNGQPIYDIIIRQEFDGLRDYEEKLNLKNRRVCIVTETTVASFYLARLTELFQEMSPEVISFVFPAGEANKTLNVVEDLYETLIKARFDRKDLLVALGGGVVGDLTGYAAATYLRGIDFIQVPTTLLSQVDSSIGGKTGVDFRAYKNMVGAFYMPKLVYMNMRTLLTLSKREYISGMGEVIKHGLIKDKPYYEWLKANRQAIIDRDLNVMEEMIQVSCNTKRLVVENDPKEQGERALLNFGHTLGHAVEKLMDFSLFHGECVSIGMAGAAWLSTAKGSITKEELQDILNTLTTFGLPVKVDGIIPGEVLETMKSDKKMEAGTIKFILLEAVGKAVIDKTLSDEQLLDAIIYIGEEVAV